MTRAQRGVRIGAVFATVLLASACGRRIESDRDAKLRVEPESASEAHAAVISEADAINTTAVDMWSRSLPMMSTEAPHDVGAGANGAPDEEQMQHEPIGTTTITGADMPTSGTPAPTTPPRSASEAAERTPGETGRGNNAASDMRSPAPAPASSAAPRPVSPTAPAETTDPFR